MKEHKTAGYQWYMGSVILAAFFVVLFSFSMGKKAGAASVLTTSHKDFYVGDRISVSEFLKKEVKAESLSCKISSESQNINAVTIASGKVFVAKKAGTADVILSDKNGKKKAELSLTVMDPEVIQTGYGSVIHLAAWKKYDSSEYTAVVKGNSLKKETDSEDYVVTGLTTTKIYLQKNGTSRSFLAAKVKVQKPGFASENIARAVETEAFTPLVEHFSMENKAAADTKLTFQIEDTKKAVVNGLDIKAQAVGTTRLNASFRAVNGDKYSFHANLVVTDPKLERLNDTLSQGTSTKIEVADTDASYSVITYAADKKEIATVSGKGVVKALAEGTVVITVNADGRVFEVTYLIGPAVLSGAGEKAAQTAIEISKTKTQYSQTKRMEEGYYDCSSLVTRIYRLYHVYFGVESGWAPTAAEIGEWCAANDKVIATKGISYKKLKPGDLVFYAYGQNGRYKNISHVEIYVGDGKSVSASSSKNGVVCYDYQTSSVVLIARPAE